VYRYVGYGVASEPFDIRNVPWGSTVRKSGGVKSECFGSHEANTLGKS